MLHIKQRTISREKLAQLAFCNSPKLPQVIADGGRRMQWVGIGWLDEGPATGYEDALVIEEVN